MSDRSGDDSSTREQQDASADDVSDEKMYTGEEVDTGEVKYRPQQQNVGRENMQGSGEWPDPATPPAPSAAGADAPDDERADR